MLMKPDKSVLKVRTGNVENEKFPTKALKVYCVFSKEKS